MEIFRILLGVSVAGDFLLLIVITYLSVIDDLWIFIFKKPLYIHFYIKLKKNQTQQEYVLRNKFGYYKKLILKEQKYFQHRFVHS